MPRIEDRGVRRVSDALEGRRIAFGVSGGIGSVEAVKIIREIRRRGGEVTAFMTPEAQKFITPLSIEWAANRPVIIEEGPKVEHLDTFDMVVIAPATLNTLAKAAVGIADNSVLLAVASQLGRRGKVLFVPTMNQNLFEHPVYKENAEKLKGWGCRFFNSSLEEDRLKMPEPTALVDFIEKELKQ